MPAKSKKQQRFMGMVYASQKGELKNAPPAVARAAKSMSKEDAKDFASTKHKGLPSKVKKAGHIEFAEKLAAGCTKPKLAPSYSKKAKIGKKPMPQPHERQRKKVAFLTTLGTGTTLGGGLGALSAPTGHAAEGYGRGANRGLNTMIGAGLGGLPGMLVGAILSKQLGAKSPTTGMLGGAGAGMLGGGILGNILTDNGKPSWKNDGKITEDQRNKQRMAGSLGAGFLGAGIGGGAAKALGGGAVPTLAAAAGAGVPTALLTNYLLDKHIPQATKPPTSEMSPETENEMTAEQMAAP